MLEATVPVVILAADADFVTIRGERFRGQAAIAAGHSAIFRR